MIETTIPEINVSELMERVRVKVAAIGKAQERPKLPPPTAVMEIPAAIVPKPVTPKTERVLRAAHAAREAITTGRWIPKPLRRLFRDQGKFNSEVLRALELLNNTNAQFGDRLRHLIACVEVQDHGLQHLADVRRADGAWMDEVARVRDNDAAWMQGADRLLGSLADHRRKLLSTASALTERIAALEHNTVAAEAIAAMGRDADALKQRLEPLEEECQRLRDQIAALEKRVGVMPDESRPLAEVVPGLRNDLERLRSLKSQTDHVTAAAANLQQELAGHTEQGKQLGEQLRAEAAQRTLIRQDLETLEQRHTSDSAFIKAELSRQSALVHKMLDRAPARIPGKNKRPAEDEPDEAAGHRLDAFYFSFENRFRGPRDEIKRRMRFYLPIVESCDAGKSSRPIVDLGCGRGEWLELLKQQKLTATGVDLNEAMIDQCKERSLVVVQADALEFLRSLPDDSQGAVTGFHIIEHLPLDKLVDLISETFRVLMPGALALFESPNCKNLTVGACSFYIDPTHRNPVFPETAQFMLETTGFERVSLEYLAPVETSHMSDLNEHPSHLRELLYGPRDFGVIGYKPTAGR